MSFLPKPPDPLQQLGAILSLRNQQAQVQNQQKQAEDREFQQAIKLIEAGANPDVVLSNTSLGLQRANLAKEVGKVAKKRQSTAEQAVQTEQAGQQAQRIAPGIARAIQSGQPLGAAQLGQLDTLNQQFGNETFEGQLRPLVLEEQEKIRSGEETASRSRSFQENAFRAVEAGNPTPLQAKIVKLDVERREAQNRAEILKSVIPASEEPIETLQNFREAQIAIDEVQDLVSRNPNAIGLIGRASGIASEAGRVVTEVAPGAGGIVRSVQDTVGSMLGSGVDPTVREQFTSVTAADEVLVSDLEDMLAFINARIEQPTGILTDDDIQRNRRRTPLKQTFRSAETAKAALDRMERRLGQRTELTKRSLRRLGEFGGPLAGQFVEDTISSIEDVQGIPADEQFSLEPFNPNAETVLDLR